MRIISANVNGIRAAERKGFFDWLPAQGADVVCVQETKAQEHQLDPARHYLDDYHCYYFDAERKGYSGTALYCRSEPDRVIRGLGPGFEDMDAEGRYIQADFGGLSVASLYMPSGSAKDERQQVKMDFMARYLERLRALRGDGREYVLCADWNIVHTEKDICNWKANQKNSGCLPEERAWLDRVFDELGYVDAFRIVNQADGEYTWWSNRGQAWAKNVGWRLDYQIVTPGLAGRVRDAWVYREERFSDHAPLIMDYDWKP